MKVQTFSIHGPMTCGQSELQSRIYRKIEGKNGNWYVAVQDNAADNVYFASNSGKKSDGFGGATLTFVLEDGTEEKVQGPWHSNTESLFNDTGYDIRDKHLTQGIVAKKRLSTIKYSVDAYVDVLHFDEEAVIGDFKRIKNIAQEWADKLGYSIPYAYKSQGGGCSSWAHPSKKSE